MPAQGRAGALQSLSLFEKVILANALMLVGEALAGLWVTSHSLESHHYLIDTAFLVGATVLSLLINILLLRASFRPLFHLLQTIRTVSSGQTEARAANLPGDTEIGELAQAFNRMLDRLEDTRREQAMLILQTQEEERRRVALELHDESSQNLTALLVHTEILQQMVQALPGSAVTPEAREQLRGGLQQLTRLTQHTLESIRTLALQLRPSVLDDLGLEAALRWLAEDARERLHQHVDLRLDYQPKPDHTSSALYETTLFRVAQECLTNIARHAHATKISLELTHDAHALYLRIQDNGQGFDLAQRRSGLGISGMQERVALLNGSLSLLSQPGQGTTVEARLPYVPLAPSFSSRKDELYA
jgi:two-component system sensor histidine kinase UhpB